VSKLQQQNAFLQNLWDSSIC